MTEKQATYFEIYSYIRADRNERIKQVTEDYARQLQGLTAPKVVGESEILKMNQWLSQLITDHDLPKNKDVFVAK